MHYAGLEPFWAKTGRSEGRKKGMKSEVIKVFPLVFVLVVGLLPCVAMADPPNHYRILVTQYVEGGNDGALVQIQDGIESNPREAGEAVTQIVEIVSAKVESLTVGPRDMDMLVYLERTLPQYNWQVDAILARLFNEASQGNPQAKTFFEGVDDWGREGAMRTASGGRIFEFIERHAEARANSGNLSRGEIELLYKLGQRLRVEDRNRQPQMPEGFGPIFVRWDSFFQAGVEEGRPGGEQALADFRDLKKKNFGKGLGVYSNAFQLTTGVMSEGDVANAIRTMEAEITDSGKKPKVVAGGIRIYVEDRIDLGRVTPGDLALVKAISVTEGRKNKATEAREQLGDFLVATLQSFIDRALQGDRIAQEFLAEVATYQSPRGVPSPHSDLVESLGSRLIEMEGEQLRLAGLDFLQHLVHETHFLRLPASRIQEFSGLLEMVPGSFLQASLLDLIQFWKNRDVEQSLDRSERALLDSIQARVANYITRHVVRYPGKFDPGLILWAMPKIRGDGEPADSWVKDWAQPVSVVVPVFVNGGVQFVVFAIRKGSQVPVNSHPAVKFSTGSGTSSRNVAYGFSIHGRFDEAGERMCRLVGNSPRDLFSRTFLVHKTSTVVGGMRVGGLYDVSIYPLDSNFEIAVKKVDSTSRLPQPENSWTAASTALLRNLQGQPIESAEKEGRDGIPVPDSEARNAALQKIARAVQLTGGVNPLGTEWIFSMSQVLDALVQVYRSLHRAFKSSPAFEGRAEFVERLVEGLTSNALTEETDYSIRHVGLEYAMDLLSAIEEDLGRLFHEEFESWKLGQKARGRSFSPSGVLQAYVDWLKEQFPDLEEVIDRIEAQGKINRQIDAALHRDVRGILDNPDKALATVRLYGQVRPAIVAMLSAIPLLQTEIIDAELAAVSSELLSNAEARGTQRLTVSSDRLKLLRDPRLAANMDSDTRNFLENLRSGNATLEQLRGRVESRRARARVVP